MFSIAFMVVVFVLGNPETQTVSHSFPKLCAALQRESGTDGAYRAGRRYVFGLVSRDESHYQWRCLAFCSGGATTAWRIGQWQVFSPSRIAPGRCQCNADTIRCHVLIVSYSEVGQRLVAAQGAVVVEFDLPGERGWSRIRIECRRHLSSPRVSVHAVLE